MASSPAADQQHHLADAPASDQSPKIVDSVSVNDTSNNNHGSGKDAGQAVRFASKTEEIEPKQQPEATDANEPDSSFTDVAADQIQAFRKAMQNHPGQLQERRMNTYQFEAFSLPPSRVPSREEHSADSSRLHTPTHHSPHGSPRLSALASPPLTPSGSGPSGAEKRQGRDERPKPSVGNDPDTITPQASSSNERSPRAADRQSLTLRPASSDHAIQRASSADGHQQGESKSHRRGMFGVGAGSVPVSRESSPSRSSASHFYSKPMTPVGDINDPYAKVRRPPQQNNVSKHTIDPRFVFSRKKKHGSPGGSRSSLSESKRGSGIFGGKAGHEDGVAGDGHANGSSSDLKRFFRVPGHHHHDKKKREASPAPPSKTSTKSSIPTSRSTHQLPFGDDHGLTSKYGKLGKVLGSGAGGSVRLMKRKEDNTIFAVKEFRARHAYETEKEYNKKVTAEFCIGSTLHHGNIIETLDILQEKGRWFEVMEFGPYDLFAIVMTGKMSREEVRCSFLQILNGVTYLHSLGLAHRDLKLDNVVVSERGIMKIIDFGSAHVFKYPFESGTVLAKGIVGSDPYLAPEVYDSREYDAAAVDIWSLAIIFCCMSLRRFPWKIPRMTDNSFKLFAAEPTPGHDPDRLTHAKSTSQLVNTVPRDFLTEDDVKDKSHHEQKKEHGESQPHGAAGATAEKKEIIRGPWRILRLLPRESRRIIHRMLDLYPKTRAGLDEILDEPWIADTVICQQLEDGATIPAEDHTHILEAPAPQPQ